ncbi:hypothetical protein [Idiomarina xiamenensis]|uniref:Lipoprotein n=1 Tax=Idiomarina xiamenensis 10-D-4 TaxID=740709 RepID=K2K8W6_9GAMM|nr:hypothetical protein [Idiomarina xiamenensis]EKE79449.1 hypothetical protein A10D4_12814 [Idiomarina xiamenensis 10-D-4]
MRKNIYLLALVSLLLTACAQQTFNYSPKVTNVDFPPVGKVHTAQLGENMIAQGMYIETEAVKVLATDTFGLAYTVMPGTFLKHREDDKRIFFHVHGNDGAGNVVASALADPFSAVMVEKDSKEFCILSTFGSYNCSDDTQYELTTVPIIKSDTMQQTLVYSGRVGERINMVYREFQGNMIRDAFTNRVEYDLSESDIIGYKGARLRVIEATNQKITYEVLSNFK